MFWFCLFLDVIMGLILLNDKLKLRSGLKFGMPLVFAQKLIYCNFFFPAETICARTANVQAIMLENALMLQFVTIVVFLGMETYFALQLDIIMFHYLLLRIHYNHFICLFF